MLGLTHINRESKQASEVNRRTLILTHMDACFASEPNNLLRCPPSVIQRLRQMLCSVTARNYAMATG
ncbi:hypothetical protein J6590_064046 [Homalodisca vitripennis]|nr:hypothetical protein J6590_064046 [Homalodisca vitripennis]